MFEQQVIHEQLFKHINHPLCNLTWWKCWEHRSSWKEKIKSKLTCRANTRQVAFLKACLIASCKPSRSCLCMIKAMTGRLRAFSWFDIGWLELLPLSTELINFVMAADGCFNNVPPSKIHDEIMLKKMNHMLALLEGNYQKNHHYYLKKNVTMEMVARWGFTTYPLHHHCCFFF